MTIGEFCEAVAEIGQTYDGSVTSWGRSAKHSVAVGGFTGDPHTWWLGVDMIYDAPPDRIALDAHARVLSLHIIHEGNHDHFQPVNFPAGTVVAYDRTTRGT